MSKSRLRLFGIATGFFMMAYGAYSSNAPPPIILGLTALGLIFVGIVVYRIQHGLSRIKQAKQQIAAMQAVREIPPDNRLFVPPPLDK